ncbi:MAG: pyridoxal phosphate-dependent aminotransferase [Odoribacter sp.]|nr:pyridoxal phosphate-dependent aminotransferase [Odoribacter sp.]
MKYNFDEIVDRRHTDALKVEALLPRWGRDDLIPLWVADMDFRTPSCVIEAIKERCENGILGYTSTPEEWYTSIINWVKSRFDWEIKKEMITFSPGIVQGLAHVLKCFTQPGDKVMVQPPVYHPFFLITQDNNREVVFSPLDLKDGQFHINFERFEQDIKGCKLFILCNPHNPGGRVWKKEELEKIAEICHKNGTIVISDEIHADLTFPEYKHHSFATVSEKARTNSIVFMSPSKAFNMPGLASAYCIIENEKLCKEFQEYIEASEFEQGHIFAFNTVVAVYNHGEEWLTEVKKYIQENIDFLEEYIAKNMPLITPMRPQASCLVFLDCRNMNLNQEELVDFFVDKAHLALNDGSMFGKEGTGFMRINVATPRAILLKALEQLKTAYDKKFD